MKSKNSEIDQHSLSITAYKLQPGRYATKRLQLQSPICELPM